MNWIRGVVHITTHDNCDGDAGGVRVIAGIVDNADASREAFSAVAEVLGRGVASAIAVSGSLRERKPNSEACRACRPQSQTPDEGSTQ